MEESRYGGDKRNEGTGLKTNNSQVQNQAGQLGGISAFVFHLPGDVGICLPFWPRLMSAAVHGSPSVGFKGCKSGV